MKLGRTFAGSATRWPTPAGSTTPSTSSAPPQPASASRPLADVDPDERAVLLAGAGAEPGRRATAVPAPSRARRAASGEVVVVGLGPAGRRLADARGAGARWPRPTDLVGYGPYLDRVPPDPRQRRHPSDNRVEAERAALALRPGPRGAAGRGGVLRRPGRVRHGHRGARGGREPTATRRARCGCCPAMTAAQAVASRVGAPARATTTRCSRCPTGSSRGRSSPSG